ncbi:divergent PAP2 family protein [Paenibacillus solisilvae]|uniref:Divergent PAP2 family protein n=1 Tax=Paenibacillus solisilvae TaxID=2486751 RepID=A0ABW0W118_9BACL
MAILTNFPLVAAFASILLAQLVKVPLHYIAARKWAWGLAFSTGGMPSSHSAAVASLAAAIGIEQGVASAYFAISVVFAAIVMFDACGIRRQAGEQAVIINRLTEEFHYLFHDKGKAHGTGVDRKALKELLGHRPIEVFVGCLFGAAISLIMYFLWY